MNTVQDAEYDLFISYRHQDPDASWVRGELVPQLQANRVKVCLDLQAFQPGENLIEQMEAAVEHSRYTLMAISAAYLRGNFAMFEQVMAGRLGEENGQSRLLAILLEPCKTRLPARARLCLNLQTMGLAAVVQAILEELRQ